MVMSTPTLAKASGLVAKHVLVDTIQLHDVGPTTTVGYDVTRELTPVGEPIPALVQTTTLANAVESLVDNVYSVKVAQGTAVQEGMAAEVVTCIQEPDLVGKVLLLDKVSQNGVAVLRKAVASDFHTVDQQGKGDMS